MLYTGHGDGGYSRLAGGAARPKSDRRFEAIGTLDEAQATLGLARALLADTPWPAHIARVQDDLRLVMAELATPRDAAAVYLQERHLAGLEAALTHWEDATGGFAGFLAPGASVAGAYLHVARTVIRRAERQAVALQQAGEPLPPLVLTYLNRLSSWIYALALLVDGGQHAAA
jgi:cob(I)alamin adenosyltransferase